MTTKLGTALDIFILIIGPIIIYTRIIQVMDNGPAFYPIISIIIVTLAVIFSLYNLYAMYKGKQQDRTRK